MNPQVAVLDIGSGKIRVLVGSRGFNDTICLSSETERSCASYYNGHWILNPSELYKEIHKAIVEAERNAGVKIRQLVVGVPADFTITKSLSSALSFSKKRKVTDDDLTDLHKQGSVFKDYPDYTVINSQPIYYKLDDDRPLIQPKGLYSQKVSGLISYILVKNRFVEVMDDIMARLSIEPSYLSSALAEVWFLFDERARDRFVVMIDTGLSTTNIVIAQGDGILEQFNIPFGGGDITAYILNFFRELRSAVKSRNEGISEADLPVPEIDFSQAEALKGKVNLKLNHREDDIYTLTASDLPSGTLDIKAQYVNEPVRQAIGELGDRIKRALAERNHDISNYPKHISYHITGGGVTSIEGAKNLLSTRLDRPIEIAHPKLAQYNKPCLSSSLGLLDLALSLQPAQEVRKKGLFGRFFKRIGEE